MLEKEKKFLYELIKAAVNEDFYPNDNIDEIDFNYIYNVGKKNRINNILYYGLLKCDKKKLEKIENIEKFKNDCIMHGIKEKIQENDINLIIDEFNRKNIDILFFKGYIIKNIYPKTDMRVMGDIDFLVRIEDIDRAQKTLSEIGFKKIADVDFNVETAYVKNSTIELHKKISVAELDFFENAWDYAIETKNSNNQKIYILDKNFHFVYLISHAVHHMINGGIGIKYIIDFYLIFKSGTIKIDELIQNLKIINGLLFTKAVLLICNKWFNLDLSPYKTILRDINIGENEINIMENFIINGGEYGSGNNVYAVHRARHGNKFIYLIKKIFKPFKKIVKTDYPKWWQYILLPYYYFRYWFYFLVIKGKTNIKKAKAVIRENENISDLENLFRVLNLKDK